MQQQTQIQRKLVFGLACVFAVMLAIFGITLMTFSNNDFSADQLFLFGVVLTVAGIIIVSSSYVEHRWFLALFIFAAGFYFFARSAGVITIPWLAYIAGLLCFIAAGITLYLTYPKRKATTAAD